MKTVIDTAELGSIAQITKLAGYEFTKHIDYIEDGEIIAIRALNIKNGQLELTDIKRISKGVSDSLVRSKLFKNDIILSYTGSKYGDVTIIPENDKYHLAPNVAKVTVNEEENPYFYYLLMTSIEFQWYLKNYGVGTGQPTIPMKNIRRIPVAHPSQDVQNKIVDIIKPINEKIVQNQEINHHLAEILQVNLVQQLNEIPEKHRIGDLELTVSDHVANGSFKSLKENVELVEKPDYALFLRNVDLKNKLNGDRRYVTESSYKFLKKSRLYGHEVIISNVADVGSVHRVPKMNIPMVAGNNVVFLQADNGSLTDYLYVYFNSRLGQHNIESITSGSAQQKFNKTDFRNLEIPILNDEIIHNQITPLLRYMDNINGEISRLIELRDSLLPKLMSGEISVSQAAK
ncbi:restriction endonuclease subunit S [Listeria monocytogenes]|nr:restriction endonuclease subunit S [Listeria monocytogenes]